MRARKFEQAGGSGTLGSSGAPARVYDELQFILGEGPCLESVTRRAPVLVIDLADPNDARWPVYGPAMLDLRVRGVYAMPKQRTAPDNGPDGRGVKPRPSEETVGMAALPRHSGSSAAAPFG